MKTKEEILKNICPTRPWENCGKTDVAILRCMQEYADQQKRQFISVIEDRIAELESRRDEPVYRFKADLLIGEAKNLLKQL